MTVTAPRDAAANAESPASKRSPLLAPLLIILLSLVAHVYLAIHFPLASDETYYWEWSRRLDWGYYDQGPVIAWVIRAGCALFGDTDIGVRSGIILAFALTQTSLFLLFRDIGGPRVAACALALISITPVALIGGFIATYDPLLVLFWAAGMYFGFRGLKSGSWAAWIGAGAALGLGMLSKHTMILFVPCMVIAMIHPSNRLWFARPHPYVAAAIALAIFAPSILWQANHSWVTVRHLFVLTGKGAEHGALHRIGEYVASQAGLQTPLLFLAYIAAMVWAAGKRSRSEPDIWYLFSMSATVLVFFLVLTLKSRVQANWAIAGWLTPPALYALWLRRMAANGEELRKLHHFFGAAAAGLCTFFSLAFALPNLRTEVGMRIPMKWDSQVNKLYGGRELAAAVEREKRIMMEAVPGDVAICAATYDTASRLAFNLPGQPRTKCLFLGTRANSYLVWDGVTPLSRNSNAIVVDNYPLDDSRRPPFEMIFERIEPVAQPVNVYRRPIYESPVQTYFLYKCYGYHSNQLVERVVGG